MVERVQRQVSASGAKVQSSGTQSPLTVSRGIITKRGPLADEVGTACHVQELLVSAELSFCELQLMLSCRLSAVTLGTEHTTVAAKYVHFYLSPFNYHLF